MILALGLGGDPKSGEELVVLGEVEIVWCGYFLGVEGFLGKLRAVWEVIFVKLICSNDAWF